MPDAAQAAATVCPGCGERMRALALPRKPLGTVTIDLCGTCQALWFDAFESVQLTPGAVMTLFAAIRDARPVITRPLPQHSSCPRCGNALTLTHDQTNAAHFSYFRCPRGHGRFTPFFQFLREKSFIRSMPAEDIARLKTHIRVIHCSSCGAPVDLERDTACSYCHAPISVLDPDAVQKALATYAAQEQARRTIDPVALVDGLIRAQSVRLGGVPPSPDDSSVDLVSMGLEVIHDILRGGANA